MWQRVRDVTHASLAGADQIAGQSEKQPVLDDARASANPRGQFVET
jgi:hypothetical protein